MTLYKSTKQTIKAQAGTKVLPSLRDLINDSMNRKLLTRQPASIPSRAIYSDNTRVQTVKPPLSLSMTPAQKRMDATRQNALALESSRTQAIRDNVQDNMVKAYKSPLMSPGYFTPEGALIGAMQGAVKVGPDLYNKDYIAAAGDAMMMLPLAQIRGFKPAVQTSNVLAETQAAAAAPARFDLTRLKTRAPKTGPKQFTFLEDLDIGHGMIERTPNPLSNKNPGLIKEIHIAGDKSKRIQLMSGVTPDGRKTHFFSASMPDNQLQAGRAFKQLEKHIPKGSLILENKSLSNDSFYNMLRKASKTKEFQVSHEGFVPLNNSAKRNIFVNQDKVIPGWQDVKFEDFGEARKALAEINAKITHPGIQKAKLSKTVHDFQTVEGGDFIKKTVFGIDIPNIGLTKLYKKGGILYNRKYTQDDQQ